MFHYLNRSEFKLCFCLVVFLVYCNVNSGLAELTEDLIPVLYLKYKEAFNDGESKISVRRLFSENKQYEIHVKRLKEVNGFKAHNLMVKEYLRSNENPLIYINNPVESGLPNTYLSLEEFKNVLTNRVKAQKEEFSTKKKRLLIRNNITDVHKNAVTKNVFNLKATSRHLIKSSVNKDDKKGLVSTQSTVKSTQEKSIEKSTQKLFSNKVKPILTVKPEFSLDTTTKKIQDVSEGISSVQTLRDTNLHLLTSSISTESEVTSLITESINQDEETTRFLNITQIESSTASFKDPTGIIESDLDLIQLSTSENSNNKIIDITNEGNNNINQTEAYSIEAINTVSINSTPILLDVSTTITSKAYSTTTEMLTINTEEVTKKIPKRSTTFKRATEKKIGPKATKRKRSTLGRPMVFME